MGRGAPHTGGQLLGRWDGDAGRRVGAPRWLALVAPKRAGEAAALVRRRLVPTALGLVVSAPAHSDGARRSVARPLPDRRRILPLTIHEEAALLAVLPLALVQVQALAAHAPAVVAASSPAAFCAMAPARPARALVAVHGPAVGVAAGAGRARA